MLTVVVCLVVVALSGAAVLRITLSDHPQGATAQADPVVEAPDPPPAVAPPMPGPAVTPAPADPVAGGPNVPPTSPVERLVPSVEGGQEPSRVRSGVLLLALLTTLGAGLAVVVSIALVLSMIALRAALG